MPIIGPNHPPRHFIPARSSRHRTACLALYRALIQVARTVPLPDEVANAWGGVSPIQIYISRAFRRNRSDTSPRIVYPALKVGYETLPVLQRAAADVESPEYTSILEFLLIRLERRRDKYAASQARKKAREESGEAAEHVKPGAPRPNTIPLLVNVTPAPTLENPSPKPRYEIPSRPRPLEVLGGTGRRQVPRLDMAADFPFLRLSKPPPPLLTRVLTQLIKKRAERGRALMEMADEQMPDFETEDMWEERIAQLIGPEDRGASVTYRQTLRNHGVRTIQMALNHEREDSIARADAMRRLVAEEAELAEREEGERKAKKHRERRAKWAEKMEAELGPDWRAIRQARNEALGLSNSQQVTDEERVYE